MNPDDSVNESEQRKFMVVVTFESGTTRECEIFSKNNEEGVREELAEKRWQVRTSGGLVEIDNDHIDMLEIIPSRNNNKDDPDEYYD